MIVLGAQVISNNFLLFSSLDLKDLDQNKKTERNTESSNDGLNGEDKLMSKYDPTEILVPLEVIREGEGSITNDIWSSRVDKDYGDKWEALNGKYCYEYLTKIHFDQCSCTVNGINHVLFARTAVIDHVMGICACSLSLLHIIWPTYNQSLQ